MELTKEVETKDSQIKALGEQVQQGKEEIETKDSQIKALGEQVQQGKEEIETLSEKANKLEN